MSQVGIILFGICQGENRSSQLGNPQSVPCQFSLVKWFDAGNLGSLSDRPLTPDCEVISLNDKPPYRTFRSVFEVITCDEKMEAVTDKPTFLLICTPDPFLDAVMSSRALASDSSSLLSTPDCGSESEDETQPEEKAHLQTVLLTQSLGTLRPGARISLFRSLTAQVFRSKP
ncbi:hypothetical protein STEG23_018114, partial [Scotinomys teguina]